MRYTTSMSLRTTRQRIARVWHSQVMSRLLFFMFVAMVLLTVWTLDTNRQIDRVEVVVQEQVVIGGSCNDVRFNEKGCQRALDRLIYYASPEQLAILRGDVPPSEGATPEPPNPRG